MADQPRHLEPHWTGSHQRRVQQLPAVRQVADNCCCRHWALCRRNYRTRAHFIGEYNVLKEIGSERAVTSHGKCNPRGVKRKMSKSISENEAIRSIRLAIHHLG